MESSDITISLTESENASTAALSSGSATATPTLNCTLSTSSSSNTINSAATLTFDLFEQLPGELQGKVISFVPDVRVLIKLRKVSRHFNQLVTDNLIDAAIPAYKRQIAGLERLNCWMISHLRLVSRATRTATILGIHHHFAVGQAVTIQAPIGQGNNGQVMNNQGNIGQTAIPHPPVTLTLLANNHWSVTLGQTHLPSIPWISSMFGMLPFELRENLGLRTHDHWHPGRLFCFGCCRWKNDDRVDFDRENRDGRIIMGSKEAIERRCRACAAASGGPYNDY